MDKYKKEDLERMILIEHLSYRKIGRIYGVSDTAIKKRAVKLGINLPVRHRMPDSFSPHNKGKIAIPFKKCEQCGEEFEVNSKHKAQKFCSRSCFGKNKSDSTYQRYIENQEDFCRSSYDMAFVKPYLLEEQGCKCKICSMKNVWNDKPLTFILDHIDGDASNNRKENLRLICHNCDSQLDTYKSKNRNSARKDRYLLNYKTIE